MVAKTNRAPLVGPLTNAERTRALSLIAVAYHDVQSSGVLPEIRTVNLATGQAGTTSVSVYKTMRKSDGREVAVISLRFVAEDGCEVDEPLAALLTADEVADLWPRDAVEVVGANH